MHNIILFGEAGTGKSSVVNMIVGENVAPVSSTPMGCTFENTCYETWIETRSVTRNETLSKNSSIETRIPCRVYDTVGLNEGEQGRVPHWKAVQALYTLIRELDGVSLLIYCTRGRIKENSRANWNLFNKLICAEQVPVIVVVTGLEHVWDLRDGTRRDELIAASMKYQMPPKDLACVVPIRGKHNEHAELYEWSQGELRGLIAKNYLNTPWSTNTEQWFSSIYCQVYKARCFSSTNRVEFLDNVGGVISELIKETGMKREDEEKLRNVLLQAEQKLQKKKRFI